MPRETIGEGPEIERLDVALIIRERLESEYNWRVIEEYPNRLVLGPNMLERSQELVEDLAKSIASMGQMQECNGDTLADGRTRVIAGQHRYWAVELLNELIDKHNSQNPESSLQPIKLRVRVADRELGSYEMLDLQITENLHKDLTPAEEAGKIAELFSFYQVVVGEKATVADFCRRVSRGETKVRNAIKFVELDEKVKQLVDAQALHYWVATKLLKVPGKKQLGVAMKIILYNLEGEEIDTLIRSVIGEEMPSLFSEIELFKVSEINHRLAFRTAADRAAKDAAGYFKRVLRILDLVEEPERVSMTDTIRDILAQFILSADEFRDELEVKAPHLMEILNVRIKELLQKVKKRKV